MTVSVKKYIAGIGTLPFLYPLEMTWNGQPPHFDYIACPSVSTNVWPVNKVVSFSAAVSRERDLVTMHTLGPIKTFTVKIRPFAHFSRVLG